MEETEMAESTYLGLLKPGDPHFGGTTIFLGGLRGTADIERLKRQINGLGKQEVERMGDGDVSAEEIGLQNRANDETDNDDQ